MRRAALQTGPAARDRAGDFLQVAVKVFARGGVPTLTPAIGLVVDGSGAAAPPAALGGSGNTPPSVSGGGSGALPGRARLAAHPQAR